MHLRIGQARARVAAKTKAVAAALSNISLRQVLIALAALGAFFALTEPALAALPTPVDPGAGAVAGDYIGLIQVYWKKGIALLVLLLGAYGFATVGGGAIAKFNDYRAGKAELTDLTMYFVIGVVMLITIVYLLATADGIIT